jgi:hypothetical protein
MTQNNVSDFGTLYRSAFAERDPEMKQMLLNQVQKVISNCEKDEMSPMVKLAPQSVPVSKIAGVA